MRRLHLLLNQAKLMEQKKSLVFSFSKGREESSRELLETEAQELIDWLNDQVRSKDPADAKRKLIIHYAHQMNYELEGGKADMDRINDWSIKYGKFHKPLNDHTLAELSKLVWQFEQAYKDYLKAL